MKPFLTLLFCAVAFVCAAQQTQPPFNFKTAFSFNPTVLAATDNTALLGAEYKVRDRLAVLLDAGYIFNSYYFQDATYKGVGGFALRPGVKLYAKKGQDDFFQFQMAYKQVDYKLEDWLGKACVNDIPAYEQYQRFTYRKKTLAFNLLAGQLYRLSNVLLLEVYAGIGLKIKNQQPTADAACYRNTEEDVIFSQFKENSVTLAAPFGLRLMAAVK